MKVITNALMNVNTNHVHAIEPVVRVSTRSGQAIVAVLWGGNTNFYQSSFNPRLFQLLAIVKRLDWLVHIEMFCEPLSWERASLFRNGGRIHIGMRGRHHSGLRGGFRRNRWFWSEQPTCYPSSDAQNYARSHRHNDSLYDSFPIHLIRPFSLADQNLAWMHPACTENLISVRRQINWDTGRLN